MAPPATGEIAPAGSPPRVSRSSVSSPSGLVSIADRDLTRFVIPDGGGIQDSGLVLFPGALRMKSSCEMVAAEETAHFRAYVGVAKC